MTENFQEMTEDILAHPLFLQLRSCPHHGGENSLYIHSVDTAKCAYRLARRFRLKEDRVRALTRAALLHDFFGYDWQSERHKRYMHRYSGWERVRHMHAFIHGSHVRGGCSVWTSGRRTPSPATCSRWPPGPGVRRPGC